MISRNSALIIVLLAVVVVVVLSLTGVFTVNILKVNGSQLTLCTIIFVLSMGIGLAIKAFLDFQESEYEITWTEFIIGGVIVALLFSFVGVNIGWKIAWNNKVKYNEYWNGWELQATQEIIQCTRDGSCYQEYDCDPYSVQVSYDCNCDDDGCDTCYRSETHYHSCPYSTQELVDSVKSTLGDYTIDDHIFPINPVEWRAGSGIPGNVQRGPSQFWLDAKARCESGHPGPVTQRNSYDNYLLASDTTVFKQYSSQIDQYKAAGLLPDLRRDVRDFYLADKVYFVGFNPGNIADWEKAHAYLNSALGTELQGDLHLVIIQNDYVSANPDAYIIALKAYWQSTEVWKKDAISKNSIIVVLGTTDGQTVAWSRALTGMPVGNEEMITAIQNNMKGIPLTPDAVLGSVDGQFYEKVKDDGSKKLAVKGVGETGALRRFIWGMDNSATKFVRISMTSKDANDSGTGFNYLKEQIKPDFGQQLTIVIAMLILSCIVWFIDAAFIGEPRYRYGSRY